MVKNRSKIRGLGIERSEQAESEGKRVGYTSTTSTVSPKNTCK
jgi:hypothetical protein